MNWKRIVDASAKKLSSEEMHVKGLTKSSVIPFIKAELVLIGGSKGGHKGGAADNPPSQIFFLQRPPKLKEQRIIGSEFIHHGRRKKIHEEV